MLLRATALAFLILVAVAGITGSAILGFLYFESSDNEFTRAQAEATATAAFEAGERQGARDARSEFERCDVIVGATANFRSEDVVAGEMISMTLQIRSSLSGDIYEVQSPLVCTVGDDLETCQRHPSYLDGRPYPVGCR